MELYAKALLYAIPFFLILIFIEEVVARVMGKKVNHSLDTVSSLSSGMTNTLKKLLGLSIVIFSYDFFVEHLALFTIESKPINYILAFIGLDFAGYWGHRFNHKINVLWNRHIIHHSSEEFNLACALRQSVSETVAIYTFLGIPMAIIGIPYQIIVTIAPIHLFAQFWYHTRLIDKMGVLEYLIVTPSHHRVHHAINPEYIDKNFAQIFIIWDKLFGTFQKEENHIPPVYGITRPVGTWNPILINYQHMWLLLKDAFHTKSLKEKLSLWFKPTGYRPNDVKDLYPPEKIDDPYKQIKYSSEPDGLLHAYSWMQLIIHNILLVHLLSSVSMLSKQALSLYVIFLFVSVFAFTSIMDRRLIGKVFEGLKLVMAVCILFYFKDWFGLSSIFSVGLFLLGGYLLLSFILGMIIRPISVNKTPGILT